MRFIVIVRRLTFKLLEKVGEWRRLRKNSSATFFVEVEEPPHKPVGLRSSNILSTAQSQRSSLPNKKVTKDCVICHVKENQIARSYGSLLVKFNQLYISETVFFTPFS